MFKREFSARTSLNQILPRSKPSEKAENSSTGYSIDTLHYLAEFCSSVLAPHPRPSSSRLCLTRALLQCIGYHTLPVAPQTGVCQLYQLKVSHASDISRCLSRISNALAYNFRWVTTLKNADNLKQWWFVPWCIPAISSVSANGKLPSACCILTEANKKRK